MQPGLAVNRSKRPEPVFTEAQWSTLRSNVAPMLSRGGFDARNGGSVTQQLADIRDAIGLADARNVQAVGQVAPEVGQLVNGAFAGGYRGRR